MESFLQLILAVILGGLVGLEREYMKKEAGLRTYALVCLGAALFTIIAYQMINIDIGRVIQAVAVGIGFIGAGLIMHRQFSVEGLTTAAGLWVVSGIGVAIGAKLYSTGIFVSFLAIIILAGLRLIEERFFRTKSL